MNRICLFPGTFDPVTLGHTDIINRALPLFDRIVVGIGLNSSKSPMFSDQRFRETNKCGSLILKFIVYDMLNSGSLFAERISFARKSVKQQQDCAEMFNRIS